jgi:WD40 repeat protein
VTGFAAASRPLSACAVSANGKYWLAGSLDGQLSIWDAPAQKLVKTFLAHTRPISTILFTDEQTLLTASWDCTLALWNLEREREFRPLTGHRDIVAGCRLAPDGRRLLSWSYDRTLRLWDLAPSGTSFSLQGHADRVTAAAVSPDGRWAASGSRDGTVILWELENGAAGASVRRPAEIRACLFLPDGETLVTVDLNGLVALHGLPDLTELSVLATRLAVQCADLDAAGTLVALGCGDGLVHFVDIEGADDSALVVTPTPTTRRTATTLQRWLGRSTVREAYCCTCPVCRQSFELPRCPPGHQAPCPHCRRSLRLSGVLRTSAKD